MNSPHIPTPQVAPSVWIAANATVVGDVHLGDQASVWFGTVIRGDTDQIIIGARSNLQDLCVVHTDAGIKCQIGDDVSVGHAAIVHGATIEDRVLVGMRATVLNRAHIGTGSLIAAGALVPEGSQIPPGSLVMGVPGRIVRRCEPGDLNKIDHAAAHYVQLSRRYQTACKSEN